MDNVILRLFTHDWKRKLVALMGALAVWLFVHQSITETKTLPNVPIRLINLPSDKTVQGLLPNGLLNRRVTLTLSGTKDVIDNLESSDLEVLIDASLLPDEWILEVSKKNLVSLDPDIDLLHHINTVSNNEFLIKMSRVITERIPIHISTPSGTAPEGYQYLECHPQVLWQTVTGPEESVQQLQEQGLQLTFDLGHISKSEVNELKGSNVSFRQDEVSFLVPQKWKVITIPFEGDLSQPINDPAAKDLSIIFLRKDLIPVAIEMPIRVFYPVEYSRDLNPQTHPLATNGVVEEKDEIKFLNIPLFAGEVSQLFLNVVKANIEIAIVAAPEQEREFLQWSVEFINQRELEDTFVALLMSNGSDPDGQQKREAKLRRRFREYMQGLVMYRSKGHKLVLEAKLAPDSITVKDVSGTL